MRFWLLALLGAIVVVGIAIAGLSYAYWNQTVLLGSMAINYVRYWSAPAGTLETEVAQTGAAEQPSASTASASPQATPGGTEGDWPSYNKTLTSNRFSHLSQINRTNADKLKVLCTYDTRQYTGFNSGLLYDWNVSGAPAIIKTAGGKKVLSVAPKDGHLYGFDLDTNALLYKLPVTRMENEDAPFVVGKPVHFCPGSVGGAEWNGPAYDPSLNFVFIGEVEWCTTVTLMPAEKIAAAASGKPWSGEASINPFNTWGKGDPAFDWAGRIYAVDADTGAWKWRAKTNYPIQSGMTPTAGGIVFFGDMGGNF